MPASTVIFDWDGVVIDSSALHERSWEALASEIGKELPADHFKRGFGKRNAVIIPEILGWSRDAAEIDRWSKRKEELYREMGSEQGIPILDGIKNFLESLRAEGIPCVIGTSTERRNVELAFEQHDLSTFFSGAVCTEDVSVGKPDPEVFRKPRPLRLRAAKLRSARRQRPWNHGRPERRHERIGTCHDPRRERSFGSRGGLGGEPSFGPEHRLARKPFSVIV